jgi:sec-independent protein translocase protein TatA
MGLDNPIHIAFLLILLLLVFGAKRLPEMGRSLGDGMRGFKDAISGESTQTAAQPTLQPVLSSQEQQPTPITARIPAAAPVAEPRPPAAA